MNLGGVAAAAIGEMTNKRLQSLYQKDFIAWQADVLGYRTYKKMEGIINDALFGPINRTAIKSSNGTSKSFSVASIIAWTGAVFAALAEARTHVLSLRDGTRATTSASETEGR